MQYITSLFGVLLNVSNIKIHQETACINVAKDYILKDFFELNIYSLIWTNHKINYLVVDEYIE